jgi:hypothetical protein
MTWLEQEDEHIADTPKEWGGVIPSEVFLEEAQRIVHAGAERGLILRVMGGVGIRLHTMELADLGHRLGRLGSAQQEFTDLDFMAYNSARVVAHGQSLCHCSRPLTCTCGSLAGDRKRSIWRNAQISAPRGCDER